MQIIRHSTAHLLAQAVKRLFGNVKLAIGPSISDGFYYDFGLDRSFTPSDLIEIEKKMHELSSQNIPIVKKVLTRTEAYKLFSEKNEKYKIEIINELPEDEEITLYEQGDFVDLCRGPHVSNTGKLKAFKLTRIAGAYWRGDSNNEMLQRIYGTAWETKEQLDSYLTKLEEAEKRDHRKFGKTMDLFHFQQEAPGMVFWHSSGYKIYQSIIQYMRKALSDNDYEEVAAPLILDRSLWEKSGHWDKFGQSNMFVTSSENRTYVVKPMNCPGHIQIFNQGLKSYKDLPIRMGEFGICHRNEPSGTLHGLMRIRQFTQDDAHVFCTEEQLQSEITKLIDFIYKVYNDFGFKDEKIAVRLATRPEKRIGSDENWDQAEVALKVALDDKKIEFDLAKGEGAFYGPKIEFHLKDCLDRVWQCGTIQVDFAMPLRLNALYVDKDGDKKNPVMIHRTILGSIERFIGILLEQYSGDLPLWLAPVQVAIMNIAKKHEKYTEKVAKDLIASGVRVKTDLRNEKIGFKIRQHSILHVPYLLIVGDKEINDGKISVRTHAGEDLGCMSVKEFQDKLER